MYTRYPPGLRCWLRSRCEWRTERGVFWDNRENFADEGIKMRQKWHTHPQCSSYLPQYFLIFLCVAFLAIRTKSIKQIIFWVVRVRCRKKGEEGQTKTFETLPLLMIFRYYRIGCVKQKIMGHGDLRPALLTYRSMQIEKLLSSKDALKLRFNFCYTSPPIRPKLFYSRLT